jgi:hypothetical protein
MDAKQAEELPTVLHMSQLSATYDELAPIIHLICCPFCRRRFDLFAASWCADQDGEPSKICPHCRRCVCQHPAYGEPHFWKEAPPVFQRRGFQRLFLLYL